MQKLQVLWPAVEPCSLLKGVHEGVYARNEEVEAE
jgi:hypothetical protein